MKSKDLVVNEIKFIHLIRCAWVGNKEISMSTLCPWQMLTHNNQQNSEIERTTVKQNDQQNSEIEQTTNSATEQPAEQWNRTDNKWI